ncbi:beta-lactamase [Thraustotheca clavata]|uniref:Beta-lactamase n=1 Tax=Thraustotheca clavata TaxID=74557 RepID=A0A0A7CLC5_9STRA|nr:secreted protein [Thraustotheca clavata]OQS04886.1 beta-lactamase [Thraustotheca clavata]
MHLSSLCLGLLLATSSAIPNHGTPCRSIEERKTMAISFLHDQLKHNPVPGYALSVVFQNHTIIAQGFGTKQHGNTSNIVTPDTLFQIGSYTKTFVALGIAKMVDEGRMQWSDTVKQHLPWFQLYDKFAEGYTTIADLLTMNSVLDAYQGDIVQSSFNVSERQLVKNLVYLETKRAIRSGYAYSNLNFIILGQVLEFQSKKTWAEYLRQTFFVPLDMKNTYSRVEDVPLSGDLSFGHITCKGQVAGPCDLRTSIEIFSSPNNSYDASGSILSSAADLSKFSRFLLSKGEGIFNSTKAIKDMITGQIINNNDAKNALSQGYEFSPDGGAYAAGYGFDIVGDVMFGHHFFDKGGDMLGFNLRNGFVPDEELAVVLLSNSESAGGPASDGLLQDRIRSYIVGIFLDVDENELKRSFNAAVKASTNSKKPESCPPHWFGGKSWNDLGIPIPPTEQTQLAGVYAANESTGYYGNITVSVESNQLLMSYGIYKAPMLRGKDEEGYIWTTEAAWNEMSFLEIDNSSANSTAIQLGEISFVKL